MIAAAVCIACWLTAVGPSAAPIAVPSLVRGESDTPHFRILYTARSEGAARSLGPVIESARDQFRQTLGRDWPGITEVRVGLGRTELEGLAIPGAAPPSWAAALAYPSANVILLEAASLSDSSGVQTLRHELSHIALGQLGGDWPRWFQEGLAMDLSGERYGVTQYATLFRAVHQDRVMQFDDLSKQWPEHATDVEIAYAQSVSFVAFLLDRHGAGPFGELLDHVRGGDAFQTAFGKAFRSSLSDEENDWRKGLPRIYSWVPLATTTSLVWILAACLCIVAFLRVRSVSAHHRALLSAQEAAEDAAARIAAAETPSEIQDDDLQALPQEEDADPTLEKPTLH